MTIVKLNDFVEIDYTGRLKDDSSIFDTTQADVAKQNKLSEGEYAPVVVCVGHSHMMKAFEDSLIGKEVGKEYKVELDAEQAFGKKDARLIQMIPLNKFRQQKVQPFPGLQINIDGMFGTIKTVSGGRCYVDFNHPLAGRNVTYEVKVKKILHDTKEKLHAFLKSHLHSDDFEVEINNDSANVKLKQKLPKEMESHLKDEATKTITGLKDMAFTIGQEKK